MGAQMGDIRINLRSVGTMMLTGFLGVWVINRALNYAGLGQWAA